MFKSGLHYAAHAGHLDTVKMLLEREAPLEVLNVYGGTVLGQATWSVMNGDPGIDYVPVIEMLLDAGAKIEAADYPTGNDFAPWRCSTSRRDQTTSQER